MTQLFLCGCMLPPLEALREDIVLKSIPYCAFDDEGFLICKVHRQRRQGWRPQRGKDQALISASDLEVEKYQLFGWKPVDCCHDEIRPTEDWRDNRDPEEIGRHILALVTEGVSATAAADEILA